MSALRRIPRSGRWLAWAAMLASVATLGAVPSSAGAQSSTSATAAASAPAEPRGRLDVAAADLRRGPLHVQDELTWMLDADATRTLRRDLADARVPVLVAFLPSLPEDESGGDSQRVLQALQRKVGRDAVYVTVDQRGWIDLASVGIPLDLSIPMSLTMPPRDERSFEEQEADPGPEGWTTVPDRLRRVLRYVRIAESGPPNAVIDDVRPLRELSGRAGPVNSSQEIAAIGVLGAIIGVGGALIILRIRRAVYRRLLRPVPTTPRRKRRRA